MTIMASHVVLALRKHLVYLQNGFVVGPLTFVNVEEDFMPVPSKTTAHRHKRSATATKTWTNGASGTQVIHTGRTLKADRILLDCSLKCQMARLQ